jgi:hypothetical protein
MAPIKILCYFAHVHVAFRLPELQALSDLFGAELTYRSDDYSDKVRKKEREEERECDTSIYRNSRLMSFLESLSAD